MKKLSLVLIGLFFAGQVFANEATTAAPATEEKKAETTTSAPAESHDHHAKAHKKGHKKGHKGATTAPATEGTTTQQ